MTTHIGTWACKMRRHGCRGLCGPPWGRWAPMGVCAAMMMMAGHPQIAAIGLLGVFAVAVWSGHTRAWLWGMALSVLAASPQILATAESVSQSVRAGGMSASLSRTGAMPIQELVSTILPSFFGFERPADMVQSYVHRADGYFGGGVSHWDTTVYLGVPAILLACLGLRAGRFWLGVSVASVLLMVASPLWDLLRLLPIFDNMRYPARFSIWLSLAVAVLAGHGFSRMVQHRALTRWQVSGFGGPVWVLGRWPSLGHCLSGGRMSFSNDLCGGMPDGPIGRLNKWNTAPDRLWMGCSSR